MRLQNLIAAITIATFALSACEPAEPEHKPMPIPLNLTKAQEEMVDEGNSFAFDLLEAVSENEKFEGEDFMVSPLSISFVLGALNNGATGQTSEEILSSIGFEGSTANDINEYCKTILQGCPNVDDLVDMKIANAVVLKEGYEMKKGFGNALADYYEAYVRTMKFDSKAVEAINDWCDEHTEGMIPEIIKKIPDGACMFALNAIYFKGEWANKFEKKDTEKADFTNIDGSTSKTQMMQKEDWFDYTSNDLWATVRLPYGNGSYGMYVLLPHEGKSIYDVIEALDGETWEATRRKMYGNKVNLKLPSFETETSIDLREIMIALGMKRAFDPSKAEFGEMLVKTNGNLYLGLLLQKSKITVNEEGTKAAAVTIGGMVDSAAGPPAEPEIINFHADRPFIYLIQENSSNAIFFIGTKVRS